MDLWNGLSRCSSKVQKGNSCSLTAIKGLMLGGVKYRITLLTEKLCERIVFTKFNKNIVYSKTHYLTFQGSYILINKLENYVV